MIIDVLFISVLLNGRNQDNKQVRIDQEKTTMNKYNNITTNCSIVFAHTQQIHSTKKLEEEKKMEQESKVFWESNGSNNNNNYNNNNIILYLTICLQRFLQCFCRGVFISVRVHTLSYRVPKQRIIYISV